MGFRFHRRLNFGNGAGLNISKSGVGASVRGRHGSIGTKGFSLRTGIPGLSYRQSWGKGSGGGLGVLVFALVTLTIFAVVALVQLVIWLIPLLYQASRWCVLTTQDYIEYRRTGIQPDGDMQPIAAESPFDPNERTLAEILAGDSAPASAAESTRPAIQASSTQSSTSSIVETVGSRPAHPIAVVVAGLVLALATLFGLGRWLGGTNEPSFGGTDLAAWRAVMLDEAQPASVRLSNADTIIARFPNSTEAATAKSLRSQLVEASEAETIQRGADTAARAAAKQALLDRKERRTSSTGAMTEGSNSRPDLQDTMLVVAGATLLADRARSKPGSPQALSSTPRLPQNTGKPERTRTATVRDDICPCSGSFNCTGPRGGQYCITSGGNKRYRSSTSYVGTELRSSGECPCSGGNNCIGPRGGHYCITSGGNKRYR